ncbi:unnamed protein product [Brachionus calyciflorus]|uniref:BZIP domain-containing protein n=1 Tax=Brachionus calyciflorus TaxID=104777 RepID=A0A814IK85_9BILA|nr:unnamed protein product [Brachionus calyciflorus]
MDFENYLFLIFFVQGFAQTSKQPQDDLPHFLLEDSNIDSKQNDFDLKSMNNSNKLESHPGSFLKQTSSNSLKPDKIIIKFGNQLVEKDTIKYKIKRNANNIAVRKCRGNKKILEKEIQDKLGELKGNIKSLESIHEKMVNTYPDKKDQFEILKQKLIELKEQDDKLANDKFKTKIAKTKLYNDRIIQNCLRTLRDENDKNQLFRVRATSLKNDDRKEAKPRVECLNCGKSFEAKIGIKTQQRKCRGSTN